MLKFYSLVKLLAYIESYTLYATIKDSLEVSFLFPLCF
jgi:hypothetical protein